MIRKDILPRLITLFFTTILFFGCAPHDQGPNYGWVMLLAGGNSDTSTGTVTSTDTGTSTTTSTTTTTDTATDTSTSTVTSSSAAATPTFSPTEGTYSSDQSVTISSTTSGATIYYTTDGSTPTSASSVYSSAISVAGNGTSETIKAMATKSGYTDSSVASAAYTINYDQVSTPQISPYAGTYNRDQSVTITTATSGATIHYTTDGSTPTASSSTYSGAISVSGSGTSKTIKALAIKSGMADSSVAGGITITIDYNLNSAATPSITPMAGSYTTDQMVTISTTTSGATIYYTTDGTTPTTSSDIYLSSFALGSTTSVKTMAVKSGLADSIVAERTYSTARVGNVTFYPPPGEYGSAQNVTLYTTTEGAKIYYTTDGSDPDSSDTLYTVPIPVLAKTVKAVAIKSGYNDGPISSASYNGDGILDYALGGWVSGLYGGNLVLQRDGGDDVTVTANGPFTFPNGVVDGSYAITIASGPGNGQTCRIDTDNSGSSTTATVSGAAVNSIAVVCGPVSLPVADSGQTGCYWNNSGTWTLDASCSETYTVGDANYPYGQDAHYVDTPNARSFTGPTQHGTYTSDYTTTDNVTGLVWKTCTEGLSGATCATGSATAMNWITAGSTCNALNTANSGAGYAGRRDWRMASKAELESIPNYSTYNPAIDTGVFPGTVAGNYWSSSTYVGSPAGAWVVYFGYGSASVISRTGSYYVRCLAGT